MKKDHQNNTVGPWAEKKLKALEDYLKFYTIALSKQSFTRIYIDAFAGSCLSRVRTCEKDIETSSLFGDEESAEAQDRFLLGSPLRALRIENGFHGYYFFDLDESRAAVLQKLQADYPKKEIKVHVGDSNPAIRTLVKALSRPSIRGVAFLDPYGPHLEWSTVESLAKTNNFEVIINFPAAMAINRLITTSGDIPERWQLLLDRCFGTREWRNIAYGDVEDLFGVRTTKNRGVSQKLLEFYLSRLRTLFPQVAPPKLIRNTRNTPLYYLLWAGPHPLGLKVARHILAQGERVSLQKRRYRAEDLRRL